MAGRPPGGGRSQRRRLSRSAEFERVYRQGRSKANRFLVLYAFPRPDDAPSGGAAPAPRPGSAPAATDGANTGVGEPANGDRHEVSAAAAPSGAAPAGDTSVSDGPRLGLSVSRRVGGAVERSRVKRVLREAFWAEAPRLPPGSDYVVVARPDALGLAERDGMAGMRQALSELVDELGGVTAREGA
jgi:ribonuclease P protein component